MLLRSMILIVVGLDVAKAAIAFFLVGMMVTCSMNDILEGLGKSNVHTNFVTRLKEINL